MQDVTEKVQDDQSVIVLHSGDPSQANPQSRFPNVTPYQGVSEEHRQKDFLFSFLHLHTHFPARLSVARLYDSAWSSRRLETASKAALQSQN